MVADEASARQQILDDTTSAALIVDPSGTTDRLLVASGGGTSVSGAVQAVITGVQTAQQRTVVIEDLVPLQPGDGRGLIGFYLVIGWIVGGYLVAALLGVSAGSRPATTRRAIFRLGALVPYAVLSGLGGAIIVDPVLGSITGHFAALLALGVLLVFATGAVTMAFQVLFGVLGIGVTVLVFVILGNPTAGGAYQAQLLPPFWRALGNVLPNGAGTRNHQADRVFRWSGHRDPPGRDRRVGGDRCRGGDSRLPLPLPPRPCRRVPEHRPRRSAAHVGGT